MRIALALGILAFTPVAAAAQPASVPIELTNFKFAPADLHLKAAQPVTLHLENRSGSGHNFVAPQFFETAKVDPQSAALIRNGSIEVKAHQSVDVTVIPAAGNYRVKCTHPFHTAFGMKGTITVS